VQVQETVLTPDSEAAVVEVQERMLRDKLREKVLLAVAMAVTAGRAYRPVDRVRTPAVAAAVVGIRARQEGMVGMG
jgi:hypothetical protein